MVGSSETFFRLSLVSTSKIAISYEYYHSNEEDVTSGPHRFVESIIGGKTNRKLTSLPRLEKVSDLVWSNEVSVNANHALQPKWKKGNADQEWKLLKRVARHDTWMVREHVWQANRKRQRIESSGLSNDDGQSHAPTMDGTGLKGSNSERTVLATRMVKRESSSWSNCASVSSCEQRGDWPDAVGWPLAPLLLSTVDAFWVQPWQSMHATIDRCPQCQVQSKVVDNGARGRASICQCNND